MSPVAQGGTSGGFESVDLRQPLLMRLRQGGGLSSWEATQVAGRHHQQ